MSDDAKSKKYDRQIRLWGVDGQKRLEDINIVVLNGGAIGSETLKNLVLPGIGRFTVVDHRDVTMRDFGSNFFVESSSLGKKRAEEVARLVHELNSWVLEANAVIEDPVDLINNNIDFFKSYNVVVATELPESETLKLSKACQEFSIPLFIVKANGLFGTIRLCSPEHDIVETNPEFPQIDLRIQDPFPQLQEFVDSYDLTTLNTNEHSHVPFPVLLIKAITQWKADHNGNTPKTRDEEKAFKEFIKSMQILPFEENFEEALNKAFIAYKPYSIPDNVQDVLNDERSTRLVANNFWILANALSKFVKEFGTLPLKGSVPDLHSTTESFVTLQKVFNSKAEEDIATLYNLVKSNLEELSIDDKDFVTEDDTRTFCKNVFNLTVIRYRTFEQEIESINQEALGMSLFDWMTDTEGEGVWFLALRGAEKFHEKHNRYPGENTSNYEDDLEEYKTTTQEFLQSIDQANAVDDKFLKEIARYGNSQLHSIASYLGGVAAQEIIKVATRKWIPMNNTYIYNGLRSTSITVEF